VGDTHKMCSGGAYRFEKHWCSGQNSSDIYVISSKQHCGDEWASSLEWCAVDQSECNMSQQDVFKYLLFICFHSSTDGGKRWSHSTTSSSAQPLTSSHCWHGDQTVISSRHFEEFQRGERSIPEGTTAQTKKSQCIRKRQRDEFLTSGRVCLFLSVD